MLISVMIDVEYLKCIRSALGKGWSREERVNPVELVSEFVSLERNN